MNKKLMLVITTSFAIFQSPVALSDSDTVMAVLQHQIASIAELGSVQEAITAMIQKMTDAAMQSSTQDAEKQIAAQGAVGDGISQTEIDVANQDKVFWMTPDVGTCDRRSAKANLSTASKAQEILRAQASEMIGGRVRSSSSSVKIEPLKAHDSMFCAQPDVDRKYCNSVSQYADYDLNGANFMRPKSGTYDPTEKKAAAQFIVNTTVPTPLRQAKINYSGNSAEVQRLREAHNSYAARTNSATEAMTDILALNASPEGAPPDAKSLMALMREQVEGRVMGEGGQAFTTALTKGGPGTAARSAAEMESMTNLLLLKMLESLLRIQALAAENNSMLAQKAMEGQVLSREVSIGDADASRN